MSKTPFSPLADLIKQELPKLGGAGLAQTLELKKIWPNVAGQTIAAHSCVLYLKKNTLYVSVESSTWLSELTLMKKELLAALNQSTTAKIKDLHLRVQK